MKLGFVARADNGGLGAESWEFARYMEPHKILVIWGEHGHYPERFTRGSNIRVTTGIPNAEDLNWLLSDIDVVFSIETFYNWGLVPMARQRGIKTVLRVNYEMNLNQVDPSLPVADLFLAPSMWNFTGIPGNKLYIPFPVARDRLPFKKRTEIRSFYHIAGHAAWEDRNGTEILLQALAYTKTNIPIKIFSQTVRPNCLVKDVPNYWEIHDGDCLILPRRYGGQSLGLNEALSLGVPVIMPDIEPQNKFLPQEMLFPVGTPRKIKVQGGTIDCYDPDPRILAAKIDSMSTMFIDELSTWCDWYADKISWQTLKPKYDKIFEEVANGTQNT